MIAAGIFKLSSLMDACDKLSKAWDRGEVESVDHEVIHQIVETVEHEDELSESSMEVDSEEMDVEGEDAELPVSVFDMPMFGRKSAPEQVFNVFDVMFKDSFVNRLLAGDMAQIA